MGALDDAIREHLELKRRHGASDEEIRRAEAEALGPARREPGGEAYLDEDDLSAPRPPAVAYDDGYDEPLHEPTPPFDEPVASYDEPPPPLQSEAVEDAPPPPPPESVPLDPTALRALPGEPVVPAPVDEAPVEDVPAEDAPVEAPEPGTPKPHGDPATGDDEPPPADDDSDRAATAILDDPLGDATTRPPIHHEPGPDEPPAPARPVDPDAHEDDVLEETPEFLQDTPDHDKLWFEQKPPRDFDLDD
jgi:hypothetical protein